MLGVIVVDIVVDVVCWDFQCVVVGEKNMGMILVYFFCVGEGVGGGVLYLGCVGGVWYF